MSVDDKLTILLVLAWATLIAAYVIGNRIRLMQMDVDCIHDYLHAVRSRVQELLGEFDLEDDEEDSPFKATSVAEWDDGG
jgi:hypothetical protein